VAVWDQYPDFSDDASWDFNVYSDRVLSRRVGWDVYVYADEWHVQPSPYVSTVTVTDVELRLVFAYMFSLIMSFP